MKKKELHDGNLMPYLGLGTYKLKGNKGREAIEYAIEQGYKHIDTAAMYKNEKEVGKAIRNSQVQREEIFITSKVWTTDLGYNQTKNAIEESLSKLESEYIDLYLIHWPGNDLKNRIDSFRAMQEFRDDGVLTSIGVSNFSPAQIDEIIKHCDEIPAVNQVRYSIYHFKPTLLNYCNEYNIAMTAYTPLNKGSRLDQVELGNIADKYNKTPGQIALRWIIEREVIIIPKASSKKHIQENKEIFDFSLTEEEIILLDSL